MEGDGEDGGCGGVEDVGGGIEFGGDVEGVGGEEVDDDGGEGVCGGEGVEGLAEGREGEEDGVGDQGFNFGARWKVGEIDRREEGVGNGVREGLEDGLLGFRRWAVSGDDEGDGQVMVAHRSLGELDHWD